MASASLKQGAIPVRRYRANSEINVTPFVDVMLVLLIIFMIAAPLMTTAIFVDNPPAPPTREVIKPERPVFVSLSQSGEIYVSREGGGEQLCSWSEVATCVRSMTNGNVSERINVRADPGVKFGDVVRLMDTLTADGYNKLAVVSEDPDQS
jgi:biopolymer transport protein ExbD